MRLYVNWHRAFCESAASAFDMEDMNTYQNGEHSWSTRTAPIFLQNEALRASTWG